MQFKSKRERLVALTEAWQMVYGRTSFTATEVAEWGKKQGLYPVPRRAHPAERHRKWEKRLARVLEANSEDTCVCCGRGRRKEWPVCGQCHKPGTDAKRCVDCKHCPRHCTCTEKKDEASRFTTFPKTRPNVAGGSKPRPQSKQPVKTKAGQGPGPSAAIPDGGGSDGDQAEG